jgi:hypothetical protein
MPIDLILDDWLMHEESGFGDNTASFSPGPPIGQPEFPNNGDPSVTNMPPDVNQPNDNQQKPFEDEEGKEEEEDFSSDPKYPHMPEEDKKPENFDAWRKKFMEESVKGDPAAMEDMLLSIRDQELTAYQANFIEDNLQVIILREDGYIKDPSQEIRKIIKSEVDHNNPAVSVVSAICEVADKHQNLSNIFIKLGGFRKLKGELHRELIAALIGAVEVGGGPVTEDLIFNDKEYSIKISTRINSRWGDILVGPWSLRVDDPSRFLRQPELKRLTDGSPEEKEALKHRVILESIAKVYEERAFIINVVEQDGTVCMVGWDLNSCIKTAYTEGGLVVKSTTDDNTEAMIDENGEIIQYPEIRLVYAKDTGALGEDGKPTKEYLPFLERRDGQLFLTADKKTLKSISSKFVGMVFKEIPFKGNPSDLKTIQRCIPSTQELLMRRCG